LEDSIQYLATQNIHPIKNTAKEAIYVCFFSDCDDKTGHLYISKETGQYHCHKCKEKGNLITLKKLFNDYEKRKKKSLPPYIWKKIKSNDKARCIQYLLDRYISEDCVKHFKGHFRFNDYKSRKSIVFPVFRDGKIISLSFKPLSGGKSIFLKGCSTSGGHWPNVVGDKLKKKCILVESCVNVMTLWQFPHFRENYTIICSFSSGTIPNLLTEFDKILIYIDNDKHNTSKKWAQKIKNKYPDKLVKMIVWPEGTPKKGYDVNDLAKKLKKYKKIEKALRALKFTTLKVKKEEKETDPPIPIHLIDLEKSDLIGKTVCTDIVIAGIGEVFHVPIKYSVDCGHYGGKNPCPACPTEGSLNISRTLIDFCRMSDDQKKGKLRDFAGCKKRGRVKILEHTTITELVAIPRADIATAIKKGDYRDKIIYYNGTLESSNLPYRATGKVIAEPKKQKASMLITKLERLQTATEGFQVTPGVLEQFKLLTPNCKKTDKEGYLKHQSQILNDITRNITKIYGNHRERILLTELLAYHSPLEILVNGETIKGTLDVLIVGDSGEGKTAQMRRLIKKIQLGKLISASTSSRTGILYHLDTKVNDRRILRWGEYPLANGMLLAIDEGQKLPLEQWDEFTTAREKGILEVNKAVRGEHPSRTRLVVFANPLNNKPMSQYQCGIEVISPGHSFLRPADIRRFDLVGIVNSNDQNIDEITKLESERKSVKNRITPEVLRNSILWAWTRKKEDLIYGNHTLEAIRDESRKLIDKYKTTEIPLVINDIYEKLSRIGFSFATLFHSTDDNHEKVILKPIHIWLACTLLEGLYNHQNCSFDQYVSVLRLNSNLTDKEYKKIIEDFFTARADFVDINRTLFELFLTNDCFSLSDLEAHLGIGKNAVGDRIRLLRIHRLITTKKWGYYKTARMINFLRCWNQEKLKEGKKNKKCKYSAKSSSPDVVRW
jgi:hypothetical protein